MYADKMGIRTQFDRKVAESPRRETLRKRNFDSSKENCDDVPPGWLHN